MILLLVSNLRFNRRWYQWLLSAAPRHDLLAIAGNLVDRDAASDADQQRAWVRDWLADYGRPTCIASGPEERQLNASEWLRHVDLPHVCGAGEFVTHEGFAFHSIPYGELPEDRHADVWIAYHDPRRVASTAAETGDGGFSAAPILLSGHSDPARPWVSMDQGTLHLNPGWMPQTAFPNHVLLDPATLAARRVRESGYIPKVDVFGPVFRRPLRGARDLLLPAGKHPDEKDVGEVVASE